MQDEQIHLINMHDSHGCQTHFDMASYFDHLPCNSSLGATLLATARMQSTQTFLQSNMATIPDNTVCTAYKQTGGKGKLNSVRLEACQYTIVAQLCNILQSMHVGRGGNVWESPAGCLMFSIYKKVSIQGIA